MYLQLTQELAAQRIGDLHRQAAAERLAGELRARRRRAGRGRRTAWGWLFRQPRPAGV